MAILSLSSPFNQQSFLQNVLLTTGLRGLWPMSAINDSGSAVDLLGLGNLDISGTPTYNLTNTVSYAEFNGSTDYVSHADSALYDILGTETYINSSLRGLTLGGWFWRDTSTGTQALIGKWNPSSNKSYTVSCTTTVFTFQVSNDGSTEISLNTSTMVQDSWIFVVARFTPSTELAIFTNGTKAVNTTSIPASIFNGNGRFAVGVSYSGAAPIRYLNGRASLCFVSASALSDTVIDNFYQTSKQLFGVT
jgi:hypothetical protein